MLRSVRSARRRQASGCRPAPSGRVMSRRVACVPRSTCFLRSGPHPCNWPCGDFAPGPPAPSPQPATRKDPKTRRVVVHAAVAAAPGDFKKIVSSPPGAGSQATCENGASDASRLIPQPKAGKLTPISTVYAGSKMRGGQRFRGAPSGFAKGYAGSDQPTSHNRPIMRKGSLSHSGAASRNSALPPRRARSPVHHVGLAPRKHFDRTCSAAPAQNSGQTAIPRKE